MARYIFHADPEGAALLGAAGITETAAAMACSTGDEVTRSRSTSVHLLCTPAGGVCLKRHLFTTLRDRIRGVFRGTLFGRSKARREFEVLKRLRSMDFPVPEPIAFGEERGLLLRGCFLATKAVEGGTRSDTWLARAKPEDWRVRRRAVIAAAELVSSMHGAGYSDGSMSLRNLLVLESSGGLALNKVDCVKGRFRLPVGAGAVSDLARLESSSRTLVPVRDRLRFLKAWSRMKSKPARRRLLAEIDRLRSRFDDREGPRLADVDRQALREV